MAILLIICGNYSISQDNIDFIGPPLESQEYTIHVVQPGDYLYKIATAYEVTVSDLYVLNPGLSELIHPGEFIKIPIFEPNNLVEERLCLKSTYESQVGVREVTGNNDGFDVEKYLASANLGPGYAWCAAFVNWNYLECDLPTPNQAQAWVPSWFPRSKLIYVRGEFQHLNPQPGDVIGIWFSSKGRLAHIGIYDREDDTYYYTVEGNTNEEGSREGDGVYRKRRIKRQIHSIASWIDN